MAACGVAGGGSFGAGGACGCEETQVASGREHWQVVGSGKGAYERVTSLKYVGEGRGSVNKEQVTLVNSRQPVVSAILCMLSIPILIGLAYLFLYSNTPADDVLADMPTAATEPDCVTGFEDWQNLWDHDKQSFCCSHFERACKAEVKVVPKWVVHDVRIPVDVPVTKKIEVPVMKVKNVYVKAPAPFDCSEAKAVDMWTADHQRYCCYEASLGCKPVIVHKNIYKKVYKTKEVPVPHYIPAKDPKVHIVYKKMPYEVPGSAKVKVVKLPQKVIYKKRVQVVPKFIPVPQPGKVRIVKKPVPMPVPSKPIYVKVPVVEKGEPRVKYLTKVVHEKVEHKEGYDCNEGRSNWYFGWSHAKKHFCCHSEKVGCPGSWHGSLHLHIHSHMAEGVGHATGRIYDCGAGFSNWQQGWSVSKKSWCCHHQQRGCEKFHCQGTSAMWGAEKKDWCCSHFQMGCAKTTLSPLGCDAVCDQGGQSRTCAERMGWVQKHVFSGRGNACALAYSKVQVECDVCRACSIEAAGCSISVGTSEAFDCQAAYNNFFRAWSPAKKKWCCTMKKMGCEGASPPSVDAGYGMVWKRVQVHGYWVWQAVSAGAGAAPGKLPYDCHAGLMHHQTGWSVGKKDWCCKNQHLGCMSVSAAGAAGAAGVAGAGGAGGGASFSASASFSGVHPPSAAASGMMWKHEMLGGHWHWVQHHIAGHMDVSHMKFDCLAGFSKWQTGWSSSKKEWCCNTFGKGCE